MKLEQVPPVFRRLLGYFGEIEDENVRELIASAVGIKREYMNNKNRPLQKYRDAVDTAAQLRERAAKNG